MQVALQQHKGALGLLNSPCLFLGRPRHVHLILGSVQVDNLEFDSNLCRLSNFHA